MIDGELTKHCELDCRVTLLGDEFKADQVANGRLLHNCAFPGNNILHISNQNLTKFEKDICKYGYTCQ